MSTRSEKERQKHLQEKYQATLANLLKDDDNKYCIDCDAKGVNYKKVILSLPYPVAKRKQFTLKL